MTGVGVVVAVRSGTFAVGAVVALGCLRVILPWANSSGLGSGVSSTGGVASGVDRPRGAATERGPSTSRARPSLDSTEDEGKATIAEMAMAASTISPAHLNSRPTLHPDVLAAQ